MNLIPKTWCALGLTGLLIAAQPAAQAAEKAAKPAAKPAAKAVPKPAAAPKGVIARDPYIGAIAVDAATGRVLFEDNADARGYPASMLKLMDMLLIEELLAQNKIALQDQVPVSAKASHIGGSRVWLKEKESFPLEEMLYALMVQSANDVAAAVAERIAGTTEGFVALMNQRAKELGMTNTTFNSVHGLPPGKGQEHDVTTARDFATLCVELLKHPDVLRYTSTTKRNFRTSAPIGKGQIEMTTHNHLLGSVPGCDGLKTGYITVAGFSIAATAERQGQRVIAIVLGSADRKTRDAKAAELLSKGFLALGAPAAAQP